MENAIVAHQVRMTFPNGVPALQGIDLEIKKGEIFGLLGPNGAGKTTLLNVFSTLLLPDSGEVTVLGHSIWKEPRRIREKVNLCSGNANFSWSMTVHENLRFYAMLYGIYGRPLREKVDALMDAFELVPFASRRFDELSTGTKQRLALAKSLINDPALIFLDEPTIGLDPDIARRVRDHFVSYHRSTGATLLLTTHYMPEAETLCHRVAFIRGGIIRALGTADALKKDVRAADLEGVFMELAR